MTWTYRPAKTIGPFTSILYKAFACKFNGSCTRQYRANTLQFRAASYQTSVRLLQKSGAGRAPLSKKSTWASSCADGDGKS